MRCLLVMVLLVVTAAQGFSAEPDAKPKQVIPHAQSVPPGPALSPAEAIAKMTVPEGFKVELVAAEPDIINPVSMTFDERGRVWITESIEYPRSSPGVGKDRVKVLEDTDGDGKADKFTIFAEGLNIPSGIAVGYGGVWVANSPDLLFLQDTDGDGKADKQEVVVTGFGRADTHELPNSLTWGPDGWLYGLNGVFNPSKITHKGKTHEFTCAMFRIHPRTRDFEIFCEGTSNPWGIAIDKEGGFFVSACVIDHLWHLVETGYYHRQGGPYPPFTWKIESIVKHKHQKAAYCGIHYFDSDAYPEKYREKLYMGNVHGNCINVDRLERDGSTYRGLPEPDFLAANDAWFMPVVQKTGPDGCLYILDWYDQYHCYQDARRDPAGIDRGKGRLYRVRYNDTPRAPQFDLSKETDEQLIERLKSPNVYYRDVAQRLLSERANPNNLSPLLDLIRRPNTPPKTRMHALWSMIGAQQTMLADCNELSTHSDSNVRAWMIRARAGMRTASLDGNSSPDEFLQQVIVGGKRGDISTMVDSLRSSPNDMHLARVVWSNLGKVSKHNANTFGEFLKLVRNDLSSRQQPAIEALAVRSFERLEERDAMVALKEMLTAQNYNEKVLSDSLEVALKNVLSGQWNKKSFDIPMRADLLRSRAEMSENSRFTSTALAALVGETIAAAGLVRAVEAEKESDARRARAFEVLVEIGDDHVDMLAKRLLVDSNVPVALRHGLLIAMGRDKRKVKIGDTVAGFDFSRAHVSGTAPGLILSLYRHLDPVIQPVAIEVLTVRSEWAHALVDNIGSRIKPTDVNVNQVRTMLSSKDAKLVARAKAIWGTVRTDRNPAREQVVYEMRNLLKNNTGDPHKGQLAFNRLCGQCHKIHGQGQDVGPDITVNGRASLDQLLSNVFDPSLVIGRIYQAYTVVTTDGRTLTGLLVEDNPQRIVLKVQGGKIETIARKDVDEFEQSKLSLMPEGVEKQLSPQELIDLLAFLRLDKAPSDPAARPIPDVKK